MKKLIYALFAVVLFAACDTDNSSVVIKDQVVLKKISKNALEQLGKQQTEVSDALLKLGFTEFEPDSPLPPRLNLPAQKDAKTSVRYFGYNVPENITNLKEEEMAEFFNKIVDSRKVFIEAVVVFDSLNVVHSVQGYCYVGRDVENVNNIYRKFSNNVYASLGYKNVSEPKLWQAVLYDDGDNVHAYEADERDTFWTDFEKVVYPQTAEEGSDARGKMERTYTITWHGDIEDMDLEGVKPVAGGMFYAMD